MKYAAIYLLCFVTLTSSVSEYPKLMIISFDGFRYDQLDAKLVPNITKWASLGAQFTNGVASQYPSFTAVNHMAIATGLFTESHGIVSNVFFDKTSAKVFDYWNDTKTPGVLEASIDTSWFKGEPIWVTNERSGDGRRSACLNWPFCETAFPTKPARASIYRAWTHFRPLEEWRTDVDEIIELFTNTHSPVNFVAWYIGEPDHVLHTHGFYDGEYEAVMRKLDSLFGYLIEKMKESGLDDKVNIIFTADHGHTQVDGVDSVLCVEDYVDFTRIHIGLHMIYTFNTKYSDQVYRKLSRAIQENGYKIKIFTRETFHDRYHFTKMSSRIGDIILEPEYGNEIRFDCSAVKEAQRHNQKLHISTHGLNPDEPEMRAVLVLRGPDITKEQKITQVPQNIDLYRLMCSLLDVIPAPNNGTMQTFNSYLEFTRKQESCFSDSVIIIVPLVGMTALLAIMAATGCCKKLCTSDRTKSQQGSHSAEAGEDSKKFIEKGGPLTREEVSP
ncbi:unnamed protein product [Cylicocyclus nassatus]|uniref:AP3A hydrolase n=1 Tax=Cylicocyclus nassatus TaxID=53992 RepID=A0AA36H2I5_CYLNA|nr:unnamed protein product [Cylicocyclus nassatus]